MGSSILPKNEQKRNESRQVYLASKLFKLNCKSVYYSPSWSRFFFLFYFSRVHQGSYSISVFVEKCKVASTLWTKFFLLSICNLKEKRPGCLFSFRVTKKSRLYFLHPVFCIPYFGPYLFQGCRPTIVFNTKIVGADWLGE